MTREEWSIPATGWHKRRIAEIEASAMRTKERYRQVTFVFLALAILLAVLFAGCTVTPADRAFVACTRTFYDAHRERLVAAINSESLHPVAKVNLLHEVEDFGLLLRANEQRVTK